MHIAKFLEDRRESSLSKVRQIVGAVLIASVFAAVFVGMVAMSGWIVALLSFGTTVAILAVVALGVWLLQDEKDKT